MSPLASAMLGDQQRMPPLASMVMANAGPAPSIDAASAPTPADAWSQNASAVQDWLAQQQAQSARMGLWNDQTGLPTQAGVMDAARQYANGIQPATIKAFHGSPYDFNAFDMSKIGAGEGAQAYGHGLYFAGNEGVARNYRDALTKGPGIEIPGGTFISGYDMSLPPSFTQAIGYLDKAKGDFSKAADLSHPTERGVRDVLKTWEGNGYKFSGDPGRMYEVNLNVEPGQLLDYDARLSQQAPQVRQALDAAGLTKAPQGFTEYDPSGSELLQKARGQAHAAYDGTIPAGQYNPDQIASQRLQSAGIPGIQYLDAGSRAAGDGTRNYVMFDPNLIDIVRKYGLAGAMLGAPAAAPFMQTHAPQQ